LDYAEAQVFDGVPWSGIAEIVSGTIMGSDTIVRPNQALGP